MKTLIIKLSIVLMLFANSSFANINVTGIHSDDPTTTQASILIRPNEQVIVFVERHNDETIMVKIYDQKGNIYNKRNITSGSNIKITHDITNLEKGKYGVQVLKGSEVIAQNYFVKTTE